ncbi:unnamed protein product [Diamesa serratosioi]
MENNSVQKFYAGKTIFITGASGFVGKVLLEKLLYSCSDVKEIIILMRSKKEKSAMQRVDELIKLPLFQRIMNDKPEVMKKIYPVFGDTTKPSLNLNHDHFNRVVQRTNIVFHLAAFTKMNASLKSSIQMNLVGTKNVLDLAKQMPKLIQFIHTSTTFCCADEKILYEKVYDHPHNPNDLMSCAEWMSEEMMSTMEKSLLDFQPNTYVYTKRLAELLVRDEFVNLPVCIVRPSLVLPALQEPLPGWIDDHNGPVGLVKAIGRGVLRSIRIDPKSILEACPVDICVNFIVLIAKSQASKKEISTEVPVFNITIDESKKMNFAEYTDLFRTIAHKYPLVNALWYPDAQITANGFVHKINLLLFQWIPAIIIDFLLLCCFQERFMIRVQKKVCLGLDSFEFFGIHHWDFRSNNLKIIVNSLTPEEREMFFTDTQLLEDIPGYVESMVLGGRLYCFKEDLSMLPKARFQFKM